MKIKHTKELREEFEKLIGEIRVVEEDIPSTYKVVNPTALWNWIEKTLTSREDELIDEVWFTLQGNPENNDQWIADRLKEMKSSLKRKDK